MFSRHAYLITLVALVALSICNICNAVQPAKASEGDSPRNAWLSLFDGQHFGHWRNFSSDDPVSNWNIREQSLVLKPNFWIFPSMVRAVLLGGGTGDLIYTGDRFSNFELTVEWKISKGGNSGIFYLVSGEDLNVPWTSGLEMQVLDDAGNDESQNPKRRAGSLYDIVAAVPAATNPAGEWNTARIVVDNHRIEHWLNGHNVVNIRRFSHAWDSAIEDSKFHETEGFGVSLSGYIVLQDHGDDVWYRNIRIRKL